jgi:hypothetical protein
MGSYLYLQQSDGREVEVNFDDVVCIESCGNDPPHTRLFRSDGEVLWVKHRLKSLLRRLGCVGDFEAWREGMTVSRRLPVPPDPQPRVKGAMLAIGLVCKEGRAMTLQAYGEDTGDMAANRKWAVDALQCGGKSPQAVILIEGFSGGSCVCDEFDVPPDEPPAANDKES